MLSREIPLGKLRQYTVLPDKYLDGSTAQIEMFELNHYETRGDREGGRLFYLTSILEHVLLCKLHPSMFPPLLPRPSICAQCASTHRYLYIPPPVIAGTALG